MLHFNIKNWQLGVGWACGDLLQKNSKFIFIAEYTESTENGNLEGSTKGSKGLLFLEMFCHLYSLQSDKAQMVSRVQAFGAEVMNYPEI